MSNKSTPQNNSSNMLNANKGTSGTNKQYAQNQSNKNVQFQQGKTASSNQSKVGQTKGNTGGGKKGK